MIDFRAFLFMIDPRLVWPGSLVLLIAIPLAIVTVLTRGRRRFAPLSTLIGVGIAVILAAVIAQFALAAEYLWFPSYLDHAEALNAATAWLGWTGRPLYPSFDTGDIYGTLYGPALFQLTGLSLWLFGPSIAASKVLGIACFFAAPILAVVVLRRNGASIVEALAIAGAQCLIQSAQGDQAYSFGVRADPVLFLAGQVAVLLATGAPTVVNAVLGGIVAGLAINLKVHAILYLLPLFVFFLCQPDTAAARIRLALIAIGAGLVASIVPFLPGNVSLAPYIHLFQIQSRYAIVHWTVEEDLTFMAMCVAPLLFLYLLRAPRLPRGFALFLGANAICMVVAAVVGATEGGGPHHLLPFVPSLAWAFVVMRHGASERAPTGSGTAAILVAFVLGYLPIVALSSGHIMRDYAGAPLAAATTAEINRNLDENPKLRLAIGLGTSAASDPNLLRVIPVFRGNPLPIDTTTWMNLEHAGVNDEVIRNLLRNCPVDIWLIPKDAPFIVKSLYSDKNIFSPAVVEEFQADYEKTGTGAVFDRWLCKRHNS